MKPPATQSPGNDSVVLSTREVYQLLKDLALGTRILQRHSSLHPDMLSIDIDGWHLTFCHEAGKILHCSECRAADGRIANLDNWQRFGSNPVDLLSAWERAQVEALLSSS